MWALILEYQFAFCNKNISKSLLNWDLSKNEIFKTWIKIDEENLYIIENLESISNIIKSHVLTIIENNPDLQDLYNWQNLSFLVTDIKYDWITIH